jgi:type III restriction enzyme
MEVKTDELVLKVTENIDPEKLGLDKYEDFLEELCGHRDFQKEAIRAVLKFLLGGEYKNTEDLAKENFGKNPALKEYYTIFENFRNKLEFKDKLACTVDLATATGKSWVIYGVAQIMLCEGAVDQVLILCPSLTIKRELLKKFEKFVTDKNLRATLQAKEIPNKVNPRVIDASKTIQAGDICIDNIHKAYTHVSSSIGDSLKGKGTRTLVLNDESHHIMNPREETSSSDKEAMKEWKKFLQDGKYNFRYIVGFSGTPYLENIYASDVVYRYNIMQAMEGDNAGSYVIKKINYVQKDEAIDDGERFEIIRKNHLENKKQWKKAKKHITIFVHQTIQGAEKLANKLKNFLVDKENITIDEADRIVLVVTSSPKHELNREILKKVDDPENPVEWIVSVSMLTEGWDVDNVFQIVPYYERAFNSKLLIAQVLGRGLRVPPEYLSDQPTVIIYNHDKWSAAIKDLVYEVMAYEKRARSYISEKDRDYNFVLDNLNYKKVEVSAKKHPRKGRYKFPEIHPFSSQSNIIKRKTTYFMLKEEKEKTVVTEIPVKMYTIDRVLNDIENKLAEFDEELWTDYAQKFDREKLRKEIEKKLKEIKDKTGKISEKNKNRVDRSYNVLKREATGTTTIKRVSEKPFEISTKKMPTMSVKISDLQKNKAMIFEEESAKLSRKEDLVWIEEAKKEARFENIIQANKYFYRCPLNITILSHGNERAFSTYIVEKENAEKIDAWIKSVDKGFYKVPYFYRAGTHQKEANFNPDFFVKIGNDILVVEIKGDEDVSEENKGKLKYAKKHFEELNKKQHERKYYFKFLSPQDFSSFFESIKKGTYRDYVSNLEAELKPN